MIFIYIYISNEIINFLYYFKKWDNIIDDLALNPFFLFSNT